ncbi:MAG: tRNA (adenosine(37)-N6)-threonylcarbamoyltransferase complex dimerization subunit type 1 TsaB [Eubacterium sp.]|nr:tRNA (adenosine(37)-N6)-threonylcarbamoyltransferase complex dimerization subunit type 1 TsaB [Eubacterium sp.]
MKILGIDSSGLTASVAVMSDGILTGEYTIHNKKTHSQTLLPMISDMLLMAEIKPEELDCIAVSAGPGSFTGLRIGASTAKGLAWTLGIPVVPVSSLMGLAANVTQRGAVVCPIMDARRNQVYFGIYRITEGLPEVLLEPGAAAIEEAVACASRIREEIIYIGDGVPVFEDRIRQLSQSGLRFMEPVNCYQRGASVAAVGSLLFGKNQYVEAGDFAPVYLRKSQAEREREEAENIS